MVTIGDLRELVNHSRYRSTDQLTPELIAQWMDALRELEKSRAGTLRCGCCDRSDTECDLRRSMGFGKMYKHPEYMCSDCFVAWYDEGLTDPAVIKAHVLAKAGK